MSKIQDTLGSVAKDGFSTAWDYKGSYVGNLPGGADGPEGYERFAQYSATPDTTILFAGPARFTGLASNQDLTPMGLVDGIGYQATPQLQRLFEIGSNRSFFTRGKTISSITFSQMFTDQQSLMAALMSHAYKMDGNINIDGPKAPSADTSPNVAMNIDSEYFNLPFGLFLLFKTRGGNGGDGKILTALYLEYCMMSNFNFNVANQSPVIMQNIAIEFDRTVPVSLV
jgi:hypothetical protein